MLLQTSVYFCFINALKFAQCSAEQCLRDMWHRLSRIKGGSEYSDL